MSDSTRPQDAFLRRMGEGILRDTRRNSEDKPEKNPLTWNPQEEETFENMSEGGETKDLRVALTS